MNIDSELIKLVKLAQCDDTNALIAQIKKIATYTKELQLQVAEDDYDDTYWPEPRTWGDL